MGCGPSSNDSAAIPPPSKAGNNLSANQSQSVTTANNVTPPKPVSPPPPSSINNKPSNEGARSGPPPPPPPPPPPLLTSSNTSANPQTSKEIQKKITPNPGFTIITEHEITKEKIYLCVMHHPSVETFISIEPKSIDAVDSFQRIQYYVLIISTELYKQLLTDEEIKSQISLQILSHVNQFYNAHTDISICETKEVN